MSDRFTMNNIYGNNNRPRSTSDTSNSIETIRNESNVQQQVLQFPSNYDIPVETEYPILLPEISYTPYHGDDHRVYYAQYKDATDRFQAALTRNVPHYIHSNVDSFLDGIHYLCMGSRSSWELQKQRSISLYPQMMKDLVVAINNRKIVTELFYHNHPDNDRHIHFVEVLELCYRSLQSTIKCIEEQSDVNQQEQHEEDEPVDTTFRFDAISDVSDDDYVDKHDNDDDNKSVYTFRFDDISDFSEGDFVHHDDNDDSDYDGDYYYDDGDYDYDDGYYYAVGDYVNDDCRFVSQSSFQDESTWTQQAVCCAKSE